MDPNENLKQQIRLAKEILGEGLRDEADSAAWRAHDLAELVLALNDWLAGGGFPPLWTRK